MAPVRGAAPITERKREIIGAALLPPRHQRTINHRPSPCELWPAFPVDAGFSISRGAAVRRPGAPLTPPIRRTIPPAHPFGMALLRRP
jgi:hypothetical protein